MGVSHAPQRSESVLLPNGRFSVVQSDRRMAGVGPVPDGSRFPLWYPTSGGLKIRMSVVRFGPIYWTLLAPSSSSIGREATAAIGPIASVERANALFGLISGLAC